MIPLPPCLGVERKRKELLKSWVFGVKFAPRGRMWSFCLGGKLPGVGCKIRVLREKEGGAGGGLFDSSKRFCRMSLKGRRRLYGRYKMGGWLFGKFFFSLTFRDTGFDIGFPTPRQDQILRVLHYD